MGLAVMDSKTVHNVFNTLMAGDVVVDITKAVAKGTPRPTIRSYLATASNSDRVELLRLLIDVVYDPMTPAYFRGFRKELMTYVVGIVGRKRWHMGDIVHIPEIRVDELGNNVVLVTQRITIRLRDN
jgi:hypothetical protein